MNVLTNVLLGRSSKLTNAVGYIDTGNMLRCSLTGRYISIATYEVASELAPPEMLPLIEDYMHNPVSVCDYRGSFPRGIHLIPYNTIGAKNQLMLAMDIDYMFIGGSSMVRRPLIGISPTDFCIVRTNKCILLNKYYMKRGKRNVKHDQKQ